MLVHDPALTVALAVLAGMIAQVLADHMKVPGIVLLLAAGVLLGPDVAGVVDPSVLGASLQVLVGFAVSVILFEGSLNLDLKRLRREARSIRQLATIGVAVTAIAAGVSAHFLLGFGLRVSILFGTLVTVTGPTVITPLLRRIRVQPRVATVLHAEGIFVDAIGAVVAVFALEAILANEGLAIATGLAALVARLAGGVLLGAAAGAILAALLRFERLIPEGMLSVFTLSYVFAIFQLSNAMISESGIVAVVAAGLIIGNTRSHALSDLRDFKERLTLMLIGMLFVLLAADVRIAEVRDLGKGGMWVVVLLVLVIRPLNIALSTLGTDLRLREKAFLAWIAPRGIVAAAVASLFAETLQRAHIAGGPELRALVFLVIAVTVLLSGISAGLVASLLGVRRMTQSGYLILGANGVARALARLLLSGGEDAVLIDSNPQVCHAAEADGLRVIYGSGLSEHVQLLAEADVRQGAIGATSNDEVNLLFTRRMRRDYKVPVSWVALRRGQGSVTPEMVRKLDTHILFGQPRNFELWSSRLERRVQIESWIRTGEVPWPAGLSAAEEPLFLAIALQRGKKIVPVDEETAFRKHDVLHLALSPEKRDEAVQFLRALGWAESAAPGDETARKAMV
ncbi:MAG TPA: sodium:proton antiporter [Thermoanaerobaculia bacterium]|nr:sodium:proton antiporter [Thermoanaerobaculia bacterium]